MTDAVVLRILVELTRVEFRGAVELRRGTVDVELASDVELKLIARAAELVTLNPVEFATTPIEGVVEMGATVERLATIAATTTGSLIWRCQ